METIEISDVEQLEAYRDVWSSLLEDTPHASFFMSLDWLKAYWRHYGSGQRLRTLIIGDADKVVGIVPLAVIRETTYAGSVRTLTYPLHDWASFYGPIGLPPGKAFPFVIRHLQQSRRDWDLIDLRWQPSVQMQADVRKAFEYAAWPTTAHTWKTMSFVTFPGSWEAYLASRTSKFRNNLRRNHKRTQALGRVDYCSYRPAGLDRGDGEPRWDLFDDCMHLATMSWQGESTSGTTLSHNSVRSFFHDAHKAASRAGAVDMHLLHIDDRPVAFAYNYHWKGYVFGLRTGYDPAFSQAGVGATMYAHMLENCCSRGDRIVDFGSEYPKAKRHWITDLQPSYRLTHYPLLSLRAQILRLRHWLAPRRV